MTIDVALKRIKHLMQLICDFAVNKYLDGQYAAFYADTVSTNKKLPKWLQNDYIYMDALYANVVDNNKINVAQMMMCNKKYTKYKQLMRDRYEMV